MARPTFKDIQRYKEENIRFMQENRHEDGVEELPCGVQYKILTAGKGTVPSLKSMVKVHYRGTLIDGTVFDDSFARKKPASFRVNELIKGWQEALVMMPAGSRWTLYIPYELGYGSRACGDDIPAYSTLIFELELQGVR